MADHGFGEGGGLGQKQPVVIGPRHRGCQRIQYGLGGHDIHHRQAGHRIGVIQRHAMGGAPTTVVAHQIKAGKAQMLHQRNHIGAHFAKGIGRHALRFAAVAIAAQIGADHLPPRRHQLWGNIGPHRVGLGKAVQQQHRRAVTGAHISDRGATQAGLAGFKALEHLYPTYACACANLPNSRAQLRMPL